MQLAYPLYAVAFLLILVTTIGLNFYLYFIVPKGFFPEGDTGRMK